MRLAAGARLAVTLLTVLPAGGGPANRSMAATAMLLAPVIGLVLGSLAGVVALAAVGLGAGATLAAVLGVATIAALTRGLHLDGLADTADGLGCAGPPERALSVMKRSDIGPFGVVVLVVTLLAQVGALADLLGSGRAVAALAVAAATGRAGVLVACRRGVPAARPGGLGALVAGSVPPSLVAGAVALLLVLAPLAVAVGGGAAVRGLVAVGGGLAAAFALERHAVRRLGGITGDVLGALVETGTTVALVVLATGR